MSDSNLLAYIRRANLDLIWAKAPGTYSSARTGLNNLIRSWSDLGLHPPLPPLGPWPLKDEVGFAVALAQLRYSQNKGKNCKTHLQFDSVRKLRTAYSHIVESSSSGQKSHFVAFRGPTSETYSASNCPTESKFYTLFMRGLLLRMGRQTIVNMGLDHRVLLVILDMLEADFNDRRTDSIRKRETVMTACFLLIGFCLALRGNEIFMVEAHGICSHIHFGKDEDQPSLNHVVIPLLGRFKNEEGSRYHLMLCASITSNSGFKVRLWVERLTDILSQESRQTGPAFCHPNGSSYTSSEMNENFHVLLEAIQAERPDLLPPEVDVRSKYDIFRSLRRGSTARAKNMKVPESAIDLHNRWRSIENLKGQRPRHSMRDYYTDLRLSVDTILEYTHAL